MSTVAKTYLNKISHNGKSLTFNIAVVIITVACLTALGLIELALASIIIINIYTSKKGFCENRSFY